jgi:hypothetical protein
MLESAERCGLVRIFKGNFEGAEIRAKVGTLRNQSVAAASNRCSSHLEPFGHKAARRYTVE